MEQAFDLVLNEIVAALEDSSKAHFSPFESNLTMFKKMWTRFSVNVRTMPKV